MLTVTFPWSSVSLVYQKATMQSFNYNLREYNSGKRKIKTYSILQWLEAQEKQTEREKPN